MRQVDRIGYIRVWSRLGINEYDQRALLRNAATIDRMNEAGCNGDWPCDNGQRKVKECAKCSGLVVPSTLKAGGLCDDCRATARVSAIVAKYPALSVGFNGDPRGLPFSIERAPAAQGSTVR